MVVVYLTVVADGLRASIAVFGTSDSANFQFQGLDSWLNSMAFDRIDIACVTALILCVTVSYLWYRIFIELGGHGRFLGATGNQRVLMWFFAVIAAVLVVGDALLFYTGMSGQSASGWGGVSQNVCVGATVVYAVGLAFLGGYHADYHTAEDI